MVAEKLATLELGDNQHSEGVPIGTASKMLNVSERSVKRGLYHPCRAALLRAQRSEPPREANACPAPR